MKIIILSLITMALSGCALTVDKIDVAYQAPANLGQVAGAKNVTVQVAATDARTSYQDRVSSKKNGYGMEMAAIVATNDVVQTTGQAIEKELSAMGFAIGPNGATINVKVVKFYNDFKTGIFSGDAVAEVILDVSVQDAGKNILYAKTYTGTGINKDIMVMGGSSAQPALVNALGDVVKGVVDDPELQRVLLKSAATPKVSMNARLTASQRG